MATLKFTNRDLDISGGRVTKLDNAEAIGQAVLERLYTQLGECVYSVGSGTPWFEVVFRKGSEENLPVIEQILVTIILATPGVTGVDDFLFASYDPYDRNISISFRLQTINGEINFEAKAFEPLPL